MDKSSSVQEMGVSQTRPKPYKQVRRPRIIIVDDFGEMKSGEYLRILVKFLSIITGICVLSGGLFFWIYPRFFQPAKEKLVLAEKKIFELTREKELLMARLVMSGKDPVIAKEKKGQFPVETIEEKFSAPPVPEKKTPANGSSNETRETKTMTPLLNKGEALSETPLETKSPRIIEKTVDLEKFTVTKDGSTGDILVQFDIRNISKAPGDVSGRIFTVLKPDNGFEDQWLVVPKSAIKNGIPSEYRKGQYFSIAHFKPVKFRVNHPGDSEFYKKASVFVFNEQEDLIFEKLIDITESVE